MMPLVTVNGTANRSGARPSICLVDFGINENAYFFRVAIYSCDIERDGTVRKKGVAAIDAGILRDSPRVFHMCGQQTLPSGAFHRFFSTARGTVDPRLFSAHFRKGQEEVNDVRQRKAEYKWNCNHVTVPSVKAGEHRRHCSLEVNLRWMIKYRLAILFYCSVSALLLAMIGLAYAATLAFRTVPPQMQARLNTP
ncbi:hypothetical protein NC652_014398 [Populus alba x Populus x berolinensis]|nr:hypothetical protein NC652_014398 [Populus alba x Populus x berolinensis]